MKLAFAILLGLLCLPACEEDAPPSTLQRPIPAVEPGPVSLRRLTRAQYRQAITDVLGEVVVPELGEPDVAQGGLLAVGASGTTFSARGVESMEDAAFAVAEQALETKAGQRRLVPCEPRNVTDSECLTAFVRTLGRRLWRRPLSEDEVERVVGVGVGAAETLDDFHQGAG